MPSRIVREGINTSPRVNALSLLADLFYRRLMTVADDYGRYHASVTTVRAACWPTCPDRVTDEQVSGWINECLAGDNPLIIKYQSGGATYLQIQNFGQQTRAKSKFPDPADSELIITCKSDDNLAHAYAPKYEQRNTNSEIRNTNGHDFEERFSAAWDRHKKHRGGVTRQMVAQRLLSVDWDEWDSKHIPFSVFWDRAGWNMCAVTMLEWWENGMPAPPPEPMARMPAGSIDRVQARQQTASVIGLLSPGGPR